MSSLPKPLGQPWQLCNGYYSLSTIEIFAPSARWSAMEMKLKTSVVLAGFLVAVCAGGGILCGMQTYAISNGAVGGVSLPDGRPGAPEKPAPTKAKLLTEAAVFDRVNTVTNYSSYGPPPKPPEEEKKEDAASSS